MRQVILSPEVFSSRFDAVEALLRYPEGNKAEELNAFANELDATSLLLANSCVAVAYAAFAGLVRIADNLAQWRGAVLAALPESERFLRKAKDSYQLWMKEYEGQMAAGKLVQSSKMLPDVNSPDDVVTFLNKIGGVPLPIGRFAHERSFQSISDHLLDENTKRKPFTLTVSFLKYKIDSVDVQQIHQLTFGEVHNIEIEILISCWPQEYNELKLIPISVEPASTYDYPIFVFSRPNAEPPYILHESALANLRSPQGLQLRPFEIKYTAEFLPLTSQQSVEIIGHRTLLIDGT